MDDEPPIIAIADERRTGIAFAVHETIRSCAFRNWLTASNRGSQACSPPILVKRGGRISIEQAKGNLGGWTPESDAERATAFVVDDNRPSWRIGPFYDIAAIDPWMTLFPPSRTLCVDGGVFGGSFVSYHRRGDDTARGVELGIGTGYYSDPFAFPLIDGCLHVGLEGMGKDEL